MLTASSIHYFFIPFMLNTLSQIVRSLQCGEILAPMRSSSCIDYIVCNLFDGYVRVSFTSGYCYTYKARKRDILRLLTDNKVSYGFWVNQCVNLDNPVNRYGRAIAWVGA